MATHLGKIGGWRKFLAPLKKLIQFLGDRRSPHFFWSPGSKKKVEWQNEKLPSPFSSLLSPSSFPSKVYESEKWGKWEKEGEWVRPEEESLKKTSSSLLRFFPRPSYSADAVIANVLSLSLTSRTTNDRFAISHNKKYEKKKEKKSSRRISFPPGHAPKSWIGAFLLLRSPSAIDIRIASRPNFSKFDFDFPPFPLFFLYLFLCVRAGEKKEGRKEGDEGRISIWPLSTDWEQEQVCRPRFCTVLAELFPKTHSTTSKIGPNFLPRETYILTLVSTHIALAGVCPAGRPARLRSRRCSGRRRRGGGSRRSGSGCRRQQRPDREEEKWRDIGKCCRC